MLGSLVRLMAKKDRAAGAGPHPQFRRIRGWFLVSAIVPLLLFAGAAWYDRLATLDRARDGMAATTHALAANAQAVMQAASMALALQLQEINGMDWRSIAKSSQVHDFLIRLVQQMPQLDSAFYVDPQGYNSASSRAYPMKPYDDREREYFRDAAKGDMGIMVGSLFHSQMTGTSSFVISRARLTDGHFDGVVALTLSPDWFRAFYERVLLWRTGAEAGLFRTDGIMLVHYPADALALPKLSAGSALMQALGRGAESGVFRDGERLLAFRRVRGSDLIAAYSLRLDDVLSTWYQHVAIFIIFALLASAALLFVAHRTVEQSERERAHLAALLQETERRQRAEAALQHTSKMEALGRLTGGVAHDFNNLLAAILGSLELAQARVQEPRARRPLEVARQAAERGARLVAQMLAFARNHTIETKPVNVNRLLADADLLLRRTCGSLVELAFDLDPALWPARADPVQMELALLNLLVNARDAMPGGGSVAIRTRNVLRGGAVPPGLASGDYVMIAVEDTGPGMPDHVRERAFEPFFTTKELGRGTGLGLSMVYGFASQLGGTAAIDTALGRGTRISIFLPRTAWVPECLPADKPALAASPRRRVLLVDDDPAVRASVKEMLIELGQEVTEASSGEEALDHLGQGAQFDLLFVDFVMPEMNGAELAKKARRLRPALPVLFMSDYMESANNHRWNCLGSETLRKPFDLAGLAAAINRLAGAEPASGGADAIGG